MKIIGTFLILFGFNVMAESSNNIKNKYTKYRYKRPAGVCFETSVDRYLIKKQHTVGDLMLYFKLSPLWCQNCSVETAQTINKIENVDIVKPGQILIIPQKCANFSWKDDYDYSKLPEYSDEDMNNIIKRRNPNPTVPAAKTNSVGASSAKVVRKKTVVSYNKLGVEPFGHYSELTGSSNTFQNRLVTDYARGLKFYYQHNMTSKKEFFVNASIYQTELKAELSTTTVNDAMQTPLALQLGLKNYINSRWSLAVLLGLEENLFFDQTIASAITVNKALNTNFKISPDYIFYRKENWTMNLTTGLGMLLPTQVSGAIARHGVLLDTEVKATRKLDFGRIYAGLGYSHRLQSNNTFDYKENVLIYKIGTYYLF